MLTEGSFRQTTGEIAGARTAMAGATIAASAALAAALGEACVRLNFGLLGVGPERTGAEDMAARLAAIREALLALSDEDGDAIRAFAALREAGQELRSQERLCEMPVATGRLACEAAGLLQGFRPLVQVAQDDLEMAVRLAEGAAQAAALLLDSNMRIWPLPALAARFEPELTALRQAVAGLTPVERIRR